MNYRLLGLALLFVACNNESKPNNETTSATTIAAPAQINYKLLKDHPHDSSSFTQGLIFYNNTLYESTGNPGGVLHNGSWVGTVDIATGKQNKKAMLDSAFFGEGITIFNNKIYRLTWQNRKGYVYDAATFKLLNEFSYNHEGWGITHNGKELIVSDGSSNIYFWDPATCKEIRRISVQDNNGLKNNINELEFINGYIYANVWQTNDILKIDPASGNVVGLLNLAALKQQFPELSGVSESDKVLNGIAYDSSSNRVFITGKNWSKLFEIQLLN
ncbi:glutamine cyclotransferase [Lacibacter cauensis]|uniref:Glutamine cyclotransferase n=1 Tax=Lacibacter cauensis TaxID=510947 RepID=A0A562SRT4_9BACT|nr:glutaminyl-peptide cyclotransferase [Lacibacter cauensis]TWI83951.1 glutamine cyclotransferase [Lacibacter cauensis]